MERANIRYALVGGYAVAMHGALRGTVDIDIVIALDKATYKRCEQVLEAVGLTSRLPVSADDVYMFRKEYIENRNMVAWSFINLKDPTEVVDIIITEDAENIEVVSKSAFGIRIKVASISDLMSMKKISGRPQDLEDIKALEKLL